MSKTLQIPITDLNLEPGEHYIQVSADSSTSTESALSNQVGPIKITTTLQAPNLYIYDAILYFLVVPYATTSKFTYKISGVWHYEDEEGESQVEEKDIAEIRPTEGQVLLTCNLKDIKDESGKLIIQPGIWFICVEVIADDSTIYKQSDKSNYIFYLSKIPLDPPTDVELSESTTNKLTLTPSTLGEKTNLKYTVYLDEKVSGLLTAKSDTATNGNYYLDLSKLKVSSGVYKLQLSTTPTAAQEDVYTASLLTDKIIWGSDADQEILKVLGSEDPTISEYLKDSTGKFMCALKSSTFYYLSKSQAWEFKNRIKNLLEEYSLNNK